MNATIHMRTIQHNRAIILAAGSSRRMQTQKLLLPYGGSTIIETVIGNVQRSKADSTLVVLGADREQILKVIGDQPVDRCYNKDHAQGMLSSVVCGLRALPEDTRAAIICLGDQPDISAEIINRLIDAFHASPGGIIIPLHKNRRGHPLLVDMKYREEIEKLDPEKGLRSLMQRFPDDVLEIEVQDRGILMDIDTPGDYVEATKPK